jgi:hypothetical protein
MTRHPLSVTTVELGRELHRQFIDLGAPQDAVNVGGHDLQQFDGVGSVAHHATVGSVSPPRIDRGQPILHREPVDEGGGGTMTRPPFGSAANVSIARSSSVVRAGAG